MRPTLGLAAVLLVVAAGAGGWWIGSSSSDDAADFAADLPPVVEGYFNAVIAGDAEAMAAVFADDAVQTSVNENHVRIEMSKGLIRSAMPGWFETVDHTDVDYANVIAEGDTVTVVSRWSGNSSTHARDDADKTPFSAMAVTVFELEDGLIAHCDVYFEYDQIVN